MGSPLYIVFAGVNGAGKSTFYRSKLWCLHGMEGADQRVNADELLAKAGGDWRCAADQLRAGRAAVKQIDSLISQRKSFNQETTLSGRLSVKHIQRAHDAGYRIVLYYLGLQSPTLADARIAHRRETGGHFVDAEDVARRYCASLRNLSQVIDRCDEVVVLDNTDTFTCIAQWQRGTLAWVGDIRNKGAWLAEAIFDEDVWRV